MDFLKLLHSLQDLMYELVVWALLLPKTLIRAVFRPDWMVAYVNREWKKPTEEQFDEYLPPVPFLIIAAVLPATAFLFLPEGSFAWNQAVTEDDVVFSALVTLITMLVYLAWLEWLNKRPIRRSGLKRLFFIQCYLIPPAQIIYSIMVLFTGKLGILTVALIGTFLPILYESFAFKDELKTGWWKGLWYAALPYLAFAVIYMSIWWVSYSFFDADIGGL